MISERVDAVVVGARCAGSAAATALAGAGRRVVALDRAGFPSDTLSTHLLFAGGVAELAQLGALERVEATGPPRLPLAYVYGGGFSVTADYTPIGAVDYALCVRRPALDAALVETARSAGAEVREKFRVRELVWERDRVAGIRGEGPDGPREIRANLVIGADGRRSTVAELVGASDPYRAVPNGRACAFAYWQDSRAEWRRTAAQWRDGPQLGVAFPCDGGRVMVLLMPPVESGPALRADPQSEYERILALLPGLAERLEGCEQASKVRVSTDHPSFFRRSTGPGWALPGDSGHFKDPVTAQGIRDAIRFGRLLGETVAPWLDSEHLLDAALAGWERRRERECLETYQWTNRLARAETITPIELELYREMNADRGRARDLLDVFARTKRPAEAFTPAYAARLAGRALRRGAVPRSQVLKTIARDTRDELRNARERLRASRAGGLVR